MAHSMLTTKQIFVFASLLTLSISIPIKVQTGQSNVHSRDATNQPYFAITDFTFFPTDTSSSYSLLLSFPKDVIVAKPNSTDPTFGVPGLASPVICTGEYSPANNDKTASNLTTSNKCESPDDKAKSVTARLNVATQELYLMYTYTARYSRAKNQYFKYAGLQAGLRLVENDKQSFDSPALSGPGINGEYLENIDTPPTEV